MPKRLCLHSLSIKTSITAYLKGPGLENDSFDRKYVSIKRHVVTEN